MAARRRVGVAGPAQRCPARAAGRLGFLRRAGRTRRASPPRAPQPLPPRLTPSLILAAHLELPPASATPSAAPPSRKSSPHSPSHSSSRALRGIGPAVVFGPATRPNE